MSHISNCQNPSDHAPDVGKAISNSSGITKPAGLGFVVELIGTDTPLIQWDSGGARPATDQEVALWNALQHPSQALGVDASIELQELVTHIRDSIEPTAFPEVLRRLNALASRIPMPEAAQGAWLTVDASLINRISQEDDQEYWLCLKSGSVVKGRYVWRQGHDPDRFIGEVGDVPALGGYVTHIMGFKAPVPPVQSARRTLS